MSDDWLHLRASGTSVVLDLRRELSPRVLHWGEDLGELTAGEIAAIAGSLDPTSGALLPVGAMGSPGRRAVSGHRMGYDWSPLFLTTEVERLEENRLAVTTLDAAGRLQVRSELELSPSGLLRLRHVLRNDADEPYVLDGVLAVLPVPARATELLDFTGRWARERHPQRHALPFGTWARESRVGKPGPAATIGLIAGAPGFGFRHGDVWAVHVAWSGDHTTFAERDRSGAVTIGGGELLGPGEVVLDAGQEYQAPWLYAAHSAGGLDGMSAAFHGWLRSRPGHPGRDRPRPVMLNTWEAVTFDHDLERLRQLADLGHSVGVERFVLDDGWFRHRRNDRAGLGDWYVDEERWPQGLHPLVDHVRGLGLEFGLWVEPEMVSPDSDLYRAHPDWILSAVGRIPPEERHQQVLDLGRPAAWNYVLDRLDALLGEYDIAYLKWDHNRDLVEPGHEGRPGVRQQTLAAYRLMDELRSRHPGVEIESCAAGGGRVDLEILERAERVWASDCTDPLERQTIQRWTGLFLPPELIGAHVARPRSHQTGRTHDLSFRAATALFGHFGIEWDLAEATAEDLAALAQWVDLYKTLRPLLHTGTVVHADDAAGSQWLHGVVAPDRTKAVFAWVQLATTAPERPAVVRLVGLDPELTYHVALSEPSQQVPLGLVIPAWLTSGGIALPGRVLTSFGLPMPFLLPEQAVVFTATSE